MQGVYSFCFVQQRTAYEMRMIGWSSAVCSSDLRVIERLGLHPREFLMRPLFEIATDAPAGSERADAVERRRPFRDAPVEMRHRDGSRRTFLFSAVPVFDKIGRASCRARVCQYV